MSTLADGYSPELSSACWPPKWGESGQYGFMTVPQPLSFQPHKKHAEAWVARAPFMYDEWVLSQTFGHHGPTNISFIGEMGFWNEPNWMFQ